MRGKELQMLSPSATRKLHGRRVPPCDLAPGDPAESLGGTASPRGHLLSVFSTLLPNAAQGLGRSGVSAGMRAS